MSPVISNNFVVVAPAIYHFGGLQWAWSSLAEVANMLKLTPIEAWRRHFGHRNRCFATIEGRNPVVEFDRAAMLWVPGVSNDRPFVRTPYSLRPDEAENAFIPAGEVKGILAAKETEDRLVRSEAYYVRPYAYARVRVYNLTQMRMAERCLTEKTGKDLEDLPLVTKEEEEHFQKGICPDGTDLASLGWRILWDRNQEWSFWTI